MKWTFPVLIVLALLLVINSRRSVLRNGTPAPPVAAGAWMNIPQPVSLEAFRGKIVVVEFWATWCPPCVQSIPHLNKLHRTWKDRDVVILALTDEPPEMVAPFVRQHKIEYPVGMNSRSDRDYGITSIPHVFVIDPAGLVVWSGHPGGRLDRAIAELHKARS